MARGAAPIEEAGCPRGGCPIFFGGPTRDLEQHHHRIGNELKFYYYPSVAFMLKTLLLWELWWDWVVGFVVSDC